MGSLNFVSHPVISKVTLIALTKPRTLCCITELSIKVLLKITPGGL